MTKNILKRNIAAILASMILASNLVGCGNVNESVSDEELFNIPAAAAVVEENSEDTSADEALAALNAEIANLQAQLEAANQTIETQANEAKADDARIENLKAQLVEANANADAEAAKALQAQIDAEAAKAEKATVERQLAEVNQQLENAELAVEVINGKVYCDTEYFLERATVIFTDGTGALQAIENGTPVVLDSRHADSEQHNYRDNIFSLPRKDYRVAVTFDGKSSMVADFGNYNWANGGLWLKSEAQTGFAVIDTEKVGKMGDFATLLQAVAVCVENEDAEYGYDFYVKAGWYDANPVISKPEPEVKVVEKETIIEVCKTCGLEDCNGHVEVKTEYVTDTKVEYVTEKVEVCKTCGLEDCNGHVEVKTEYVTDTKVEYVTEKVEVCKTCGLEDCNGHVEVKTEYVTDTKVEYVTEKVEVCKTCGLKDCNGHTVEVEKIVEKEIIVEKPIEVIVEVCMVCGASDCDGHVVEKEVIVYVPVTNTPENNDDPRDNTPANNDDPRNSDMDDNDGLADDLADNNSNSNNSNPMNSSNANPMASSSSNPMSSGIAGDMG